MKNRKSLTASLALAVAVVAPLAGLQFPRHAGIGASVCFALWLAFVGLIGFLILYTGRMGRWRALLFIVMAWAFIVHFKAFLLGLGRNPFFSPEVQEVPYCHIAIAASILNYVYQQYLALQSGSWKLWGPLSLGCLWLVLTLAIGQAWCSWGCFYGGLDDGFSRILKKPLWRRFHLPPRWRDLPAAILLFMALASLSTMLPVFCLWVCPLKFTTAFLDTYGPVRLVQIVIFSGVGLAALVILPLVLKKRVFCGLICPFGAWQAFFGRVSPFRVSILPDRCNQCGLCVRACPTWVLEEESLERYEVSSYCNRCGQCIDVCPTGGITYTLLGKDVPRPAKGTLHELLEARSLFVLCALWVGGAVGGLFVPETLWRLAHTLWR
jgi:polyferredoxin